jgi:glucose/arabinose dehydrogenase
MKSRTVLALSGILLGGIATLAQQAGQLPRIPLPEGPTIVNVVEGRIRVVPVTRGLSHPWSLAFMPDGSMLVTERAGQVRLVRDGVLDPKPIPGVPKVHAVRLSGLMDIALHPNFAQNQLVYLTYTKNLKPEPLEVSTTLARGRFVNNEFVDMKDIFNAEAWPGNGGSGSRITFGPDGMLYMSTGASNGDFAQDLSSTRGKILRLRDDGTPAPGNPFASRAGAAPAVYSYGHRNSLGLAFHPATGALWNSEMGPNGGDEVNIIQPGKNYGWPVISYGRTYEGPPVAAIPWKEGVELPWAYWVPGISPSGLSFYTGDRYFPTWKNSVFIGAMRVGQVEGTGHLVRIQFDATGHERRRELLLTGLAQRIRDIKQGPDGFLYLLTEEDNGAILRLERAQ